ncbi:STAS domain-containing protein [Longispora albida]|uniref:STAS domain-containing protein n=1 Tax=Longispora albida TaxID=203523 RepID=UPI00037DF6B4|nr:STAS domain-containing protein [Longispora albida]
MYDTGTQAGAHSDGLRFAVTDHGGCRVLALAGELDLAVRGAQEGEFIALVASAPGGLAVIDLAGVSFCDSTGVGVLVAAARRLWASGGAVRLARPQPWVARVLEASGVTGAMPVYATVEEASAA